MSQAASNAQGGTINFGTQTNVPWWLFVVGGVVLLGGLLAWVKKGRS